MVMKHQEVQKNQLRRDFILQGNLWEVIFKIGLPLVFYNGISQIFSMLDTLLAASLGSKIVSIVSFVSQIQSLFTAVSAGLGVGGGILIAQAIGAQDNKQISKLITSLVALTIILILLIVGFALPFAPWILYFFNIPKDLIDIGIPLFRIELVGLIFININTLYFSLARARGNSERIFVLNILILVTKLGISLIFIKVLHFGPLSLSVASLLAQGIVSFLAIRSLFQHEGNSIIYSLQTEGISISETRRIITLSTPVFLEKFIFNYGKAVVNAMSAEYGSMAIGALGVSNRIGGLATMPPIGIQDAEATIISQNLGNKNTRRAFKTFTITCIINLFLGILFFIIMSYGKSFIIDLFAKGDPTFSFEIAKVYNYERYASVFLALSSSVMGLLYGFGYTRIAMVLNLLRLFAFRIPPLWYFQHYTNLKTEGLGLAMMISNILMGISAIIVALMLIKRWHKQH